MDVAVSGSKGRHRLLRAFASAVAGAAVATSLTACANPTADSCSLDAVSDVQTQLNGGHHPPTSTGGFSRSDLTQGLTVVCAGDYSLSFGGAPAAGAVAIVTGADPLGAFAANVPSDATATDSGTDREWFETGDGTYAIKAVTLTEYPGQKNLWAIEYYSLAQTAG